MTISSSITEAATGPDIKRQTMSTTGTNGWIWGMGAGDCEKVNSKEATRRLPHIVKLSRQTADLHTCHVEQRSVIASSQCPARWLPVNESLPWAPIRMTLNLLHLCSRKQPARCSTPACSPRHEGSDRGLKKKKNKEEKKKKIDF